MLGSELLVTNSIFTQPHDPRARMYEDYYMDRTHDHMHVSIFLVEWLSFHADPVFHCLF